MQNKTTAPAAAATSAERQERRAENYDKFWRIVKIMPLLLVMPMTAFFKMQAVLVEKKGEKKSETSS